jgi:hypothetical protein
MRYVLSVLMIVMLILHNGYGQEGSGTITGRVLDAMTNQPLPGANVVVSGLTLGAATDSEGQFRIERLPFGTYSLRTTMVGYMPLVTTDVVVSSARPTTVEIRLQEMAIDISTVDVVASPFQRMPEAPLSNYTQSNEEIRRLPGGFEDVVRAISILPGVVQAEPGRNDLIVRGGAPSENLYVVNGIELPSINHFGTQGVGGGPLSFINLDFVQGTSFSTGGFGVAHGDKLSSILDLSLRKGRDDRLGGKATLSATQFGVNAEGPTCSDGSFLFSARRSYLDLIFKAAGFGFVPEYWDFLFAASQRLGPSDNLSLLGIAVLDNVRLFNDTPDKRFENSRILASDQTQYIGGVSWQHIFSSGYTRLTLSRTDVTYRSRQRDSLLTPTFKNDSRETEWTLRGDILVHPWKGLEFTTGVQAKFIRFQSDIFLNAFIPNLQQQFALDASLAKTTSKAAAYLQASQTINNLRITLGGRVDHFPLINDPTAWSGRLALGYALSSKLSLTLSIGEYTQAPSYVWLVANPDNRNLKHVRATQYIAGFEYLLREDTKLTVETYLKRYRDYPASLTRTYLVLANTGAGFGGSEDGFASFGLEPLASKGTGRSFGVEVFLQKKLSDIPCYGTVSLSYGKALFTALDGIERAGSYDQRWIINVGGGYIFNERWEVSGRFRYATGRPYMPFNPDGTQNPARYNTARLAPNHSLDVRLDRRWNFSRWTLIAYLDVQNIYNRKPVNVPRYNARTGQAEESRAIGILPSIGISAEF